MTRTRIAAALTLALSVSAGASLLADVRTEDKSLVRFEGGLGKVINFFAGKAANLVRGASGWFDRRRKGRHAG